MLSETEINLRLQASLDPSLPPESPYPADFFDQPPRQAAVLIPFVPQPDGWHLLLIRRASHPQDRHSGQVAFPGGRCDPQDSDAEHAALREAQEEIGLQPTDARLLGKVRAIRTITNYLVHPIVAAMPWPYALQAQESEVARIFSIPLAWLADPANREVRRREIQLQDTPIPVIYFDTYDGELLWGATARIMVMLLEGLGLAQVTHRYQ